MADRARPKTLAQDLAFFVLAAIVAVVFVVSVNVIFLRTPEEVTMGVVQKILYFHAPSAYAMYVGAAACFAGSLGFLVKPNDFWDALARAGAEAAVIFGMIVCVTGPLWAVKSWGFYWTWDPRLTTSLLSILMYVAYLILRGFTGDGPGERKFAAALGVLAAANLPIIHFAVRKWGGQHPEVNTGKGGGMHPSMVQALLLGFLAFTLLVALLLWMRVRLEMAKSRLARAEEDAIDLGLDTRTET
ncbi:MAG: cytochrome c biogenesis protein CcsA [Polyangiaceae bacterium]